jgi:hypothetical protein
VCYSVAIRTVFLAYFTTYVIEPGYEKPIRSLDKVLKSEKSFGFPERSEILYAYSSDSVDLATLRSAVRCTDYDTCFKWATLYHNISTILHDVKTEQYRRAGKWTDENKRPLFCEREDGLVRNLDFVFLVEKVHPLLEYINYVITQSLSEEFLCK